MMLSHDVSKDYNSFIVSKGAVDSFFKKFPLARIFPLAVMHRGEVKLPVSAHPPAPPRLGLSSRANKIGV